MIRLGIPKEPLWIELMGGVRLRVRPLTTAVYEAARATGQRKAIQIAVEQGLIEAAGGTIVDLPDSTDKDGVAGLSQMFFVQGLAVHAIIEWEGVGDAEGNSAQVTQENVEEMIRDFPTIADQFAVAYITPLSEAIEEGNALSAAPNGTLEAAPDTVQRAEKTKTRAPKGSLEEVESHAQAG